MNKNIKELMGYNIKEEELSELGFTRIRIDEHSDLSESMGTKRKTATLSRTIVKICDEIIRQELSFAESDDVMICERILKIDDEGEENDKLDVVYISKHERIAGCLNIVGGVIEYDKLTKARAIGEYDLEMRNGTAIVACIFNKLCKEEEFAGYYHEYMLERKGYLEKDEHVIMSNSANRSIILMSDFTYRALLENMYEIGKMIEVRPLFSTDPIFESHFTSATMRPFLLVKNMEISAVTEVKLPETPKIISSIDTSIYSEEELALVPKMNHFVANKDFDLLIKAVNGGFRNIILSGEAGTGKSLMSQKLAEHLGMPWIQFNMTAEMETIEVVGKYVPATEESNNIHYQRLVTITPEDLAYGNFSEVYAKITGKIKEDADRLDVMLAHANLMKQALDYKASKSFDFIESNIIKAMKRGYVLEIEEGNLANVLSGVNSLFDTERGYCRMENGEEVRRHPNCIVIMTMNSDYEGTVKMNPAVLDRFGIKMHICELTADEYVRRAKAKGTTLNDAILEKMANILISVNDYNKVNGYQDGVCGARTFLNWVAYTQVLSDYKEAMKHTLLTSCSMNVEIMKEIMDYISPMI